MPWIPGTTSVGLQRSAAKSVSARTRKPTIASVQRIERTDRPPEGLGGGRYAHAAVGKPHRGQKCPRYTVPQRGHGHPEAAAYPAGDAVAGVPHRGQNDPSNVVPPSRRVMTAPLNIAGPSSGANAVRPVRREGGT